MTRRYDERYRMPNKLIERQANEMLAQFCQRHPDKPLSIPIDVVNIMDILWDFYVDSEDLASQYGNDTIGALFINDGERRIVIDISIDPEVFPKMLGRYNFSVAHEAGHWVMHAPELLTKEKMPELFEEKSEPTILCRSSMIDERERQANRFAGYLLMPKELVVKMWRKKFGEDTKPFNVFSELQELREKYHLPDDGKVFCKIACEFANEFKVSPEAMQIRLSELGLIELEENFQEYLF